MSHVHLYLPCKGCCVPLWPHYAQITRLTHDSSCRSPHLSPRLNLKNLPRPCFFFLFCGPFAYPNSLCPGLGGYGGELFFHFKDKCFHEEGSRGRPLFTRCCRLLPPQFEIFCGSHPPLHALCTLLLVPFTVLNNFVTPTFTSGRLYSS